MNTERDMNLPSTAESFSGYSSSQLMLVAEDDACERTLLRRAFQRAGLPVRAEFVNDGDEVIHFLAQSPPGQLPALLLLDLKMPKVDGFEVLEWLHGRPELRPAHIVVFSSSPNSSDIARASRLGVDHYLVKPLDPAELIPMVKRLEPYLAEEFRAAAASVDSAEANLVAVA